MPRLPIGLPNRRTFLRAAAVTGTLLPAGVLAQRLGRSPLPAELLDRDWTQPYRRNAGLLPVLKRIYEGRADFWPEYHLCEQLVDVEESFQLWRFRHMKTVERIIGHRRGTGGSSGVAFLKKALDLEFFPELLDVRTELGV